MRTSQQRKGFGVENRIVKAIEAVGVKAERVPLSGAAKYQGNSGDVDIYAIPEHDFMKAEIKARKGGDGWKTLERWLGEQDLLIMVEDRKSPLVALRWNTFLEMLKALNDGGRLVQSVGKSGRTEESSRQTEEDDNQQPRSKKRSQSSGKTGRGDASWYDKDFNDKRDKAER